MDAPLDGQVAIVTGAGSGIGRAVAATLAGSGAAVVAADIDEATARETAQNIGGTARPAQLDVGDVEGVDALVREVVADHGRIDALCNNAGITDTMQVPGEMSPQTWEKVVRVNLTGPFLLSRAVLPHMVAAGSGSVINIASEAGLRGGTSGAAYTASKHGVIGLTRNIAWTHARDGVRCNAVCPGMVETNIGAAGFDEQGLQRLAPVMGLTDKLGQPQDIADVVLFLATAQSSFVNGAVLPADGGWSAG
jgi:NAD(P)-dependent dehydrogenase (short-subunit alcohol dehydrogenase family)